MTEQANDIADVVRVAKGRYPGRKFMVLGDSSGAHSVPAALANETTRVDVEVIQAGLYDPLAHYCRAGSRLSPPWPPQQKRTTTC